MYKKIFIIIIILIISIIVSFDLLMQTNQPSNSINEIVQKSNNIQQNEQGKENNEFTSKKYYLHKSNIEKPSEEFCKNAQKKALQGLDEKEVKDVQKLLRETHVMLEHRLIDAVRLIKEPDSPYWVEFNIDAVYKDPSSGNMVKSDGFYNNVGDLKKIENIVKEPHIKNKMKEIYSKLQDAMDKHNLEECFKVHEIIHDYDYWCINYPVYFETFPPADWEGIDIYFGTIH